MTHIELNELSSSVSSLRLIEHLFEENVRTLDTLLCALLASSVREVFDKHEAIVSFNSNGHRCFRANESGRVGVSRIKDMDTTYELLAFACTYPDLFPHTIDFALIG
jgi:hypothetical protein